MLTYLYLSVEYHRKNYEKNFERLTRGLETDLKSDYFKMVKKSLPRGKKIPRLEPVSQVAFNFSTVPGVAFELDSFFNSLKRLLDCLAQIITLELKNSELSSIRKFCKKCGDPRGNIDLKNDEFSLFFSKNHPELAVRYSIEWMGWIENLNDYRDHIAHKLIEEPVCYISFYWPKEISIKTTPKTEINLGWKGKNILKYNQFMVAEVRNLMIWTLDYLDTQNP